METKGKSNVSGNSSTGTKLRPGIGDRIRNRASGRDSSRSNGGSDNGSGDGNNGSTSATGDGPIADDIGASGGVESRSTNADTELFIIDKSVSRRTTRTGTGTDTGSDGDRSDSGTGSDTNQTAPAETITNVKPSLLSVEEIINDDGLYIKDSGKKKSGVRQTKASKRASTVDNSLLIPLKVACGFIFNIPVYLGWGKHWELSEDENDELATNVRDVLNSFPSQSTVDFLKSLDKWMPVVVLGMSMYAMISIRYQMTRQLLLEKKVRAIRVAQGTEQPEAEIHANESGEEIPFKKLVM